MEGGWLSSTAEVCYWRSLIRGWAGVMEVGEGWKREEGVRFEEWVLGRVR